MTGPVPELDQQDAAEVFAAACPGVRVDRVTEFTSGYTSRHWRVDTDEGPMLLKLPVRDPGATHVRHLIAATRAAAEAGVPTVRFRAFMPHSARTGGPVLVQELVEGERASACWPELGGSVRAEISRQLGGLVATLHSRTAGDFTDLLGRLCCTGPDDYLEQHVRRPLAELHEVPLPVDREELAQRLARGVHRWFGRFVPSLVHHDLWLDNVLVRDGAVVAVLDFEHARYDDRSAEFGKLGELIFEWYPETREPFLAGYRERCRLEPPAPALIHLQQGIYNVRTCAYFRQWQPSLMEAYLQRIVSWLREAPDDDRP